MARRGDTVTAMSADTVPDADWGTVTGWGRTAPTAALLVRPRTYEEAAVAVRDCGARGGIARGSAGRTGTRRRTPGAPCST